MHADAWIENLPNDAYASATRTRGCICAPGTNMAQLWHNSQENGWALGAAHRRARVDGAFLKNDAYAPSAPTRGGSFC